MMSDLNISHGKMSEFISFPLFPFTLVIKLQNFDLEVIEIFQYFLIKKIYDVTSAYVPSKNV